MEKGANCQKRGVEKLGIPEVEDQPTQREGDWLGDVIGLATVACHINPNNLNSLSDFMENHQTFK